MRERGYLCEIVERWNPYARVRHDLFGFGDVICLGRDEVILVQTTSGSNMADRIDKVTNHDNIAAVRKAGVRVIVHGWRKLKSGWAVREEDVS